MTIRCSEKVLWDARIKDISLAGFSEHSFPIRDLKSTDNCSWIFFKSNQYIDLKMPVELVLPVHDPCVVEVNVNVRYIGDSLRRLAGYYFETINDLELVGDQLAKTNLQIGELNKLLDLKDKHLNEADLRLAKITDEFVPSEAQLELLKELLIDKHMHSI